MSDVEVRPLSRLPIPGGRQAAMALHGGAPSRRGLSFAAMQITTTPAAKSTIVVEVEVPAERLTSAVGEATRALSRRTKVPGFRPGKAPRGVLEAVLGHGAVLEEAVDRVVQSAYRDALIEKEILPLTNADVEIVQAEEGKPLIFKATVPIRPEVQLGDYRELQLPARDRGRSTTARVDKVIEEMRDQSASLAPVEDRTARKGDYAVIKYEGTRDGAPFEGGATERMPLIIGEDRLIPGFEDELVGLNVGDTKGFDITFPADYGEESLAGQTGPLRGRAAGAPREGPARAGRGLRPLDGRLRRPRRAARRDPQAARAERPRQGPPRLLRPDHRVRRRELDDRPARHPGRPGGRGDARRVPRRARPAGDQRGGLREGRRQEPRGPPRRLPAGRREARPRPAGAQPDRRGRGPR